MHRLRVDTAILQAAATDPPQVKKIQKKDRQSAPKKSKGNTKAKRQKVEKESSEFKAIQKKLDGKIEECENICINLLDDENASAPLPCCSGFTHGGSVTLVEIVKVNGREVSIYGKGQKTGDDKCPGGVNKHRQASVKTARKAAMTGKYDYLTMNRQWSTTTGGVSTHTDRPDVIGVRCDGKVDAWEIISENDKPKDLQKRVDEGMATLPKANRGNTFVIDKFC